MNAAKQRRLTPLLLALIVVLGALLLLLLAGMGRRVQWSTPRALAPLPAAGNPGELPRALPLEQFAPVWQKPLFSPDRKPIAHAAAGGSGLGDLELTGVILTPGLRMALLHDKSGDRQVRLHEGTTLPDGSVTLVEVRARSALFDSSAGRTELKLPAGASLDEPKAGTAAATGEHAGQVGALMQVAPAGAGARKADDRSGDGHVIVAPPPSVPAGASASPTAQPLPMQAPALSPIGRLRENARRRRAARAAAAHEGVR